MMGTIKAFDFKIDIYGARVILATNFIGNTCLSDAEVDNMIAALKANLDAVALEMKAAIRKQASDPLELK